MFNVGWIYLEINFFLAISYFIFWAVLTFGKKLKAHLNISFSQWSLLGRVFIAFSLLFPFLAMLVPESHLIKTPIQADSGLNRNFSSTFLDPEWALNLSHFQTQLLNFHKNQTDRIWIYLILAIGLFGIATALCQLLRGLLRTCSILKNGTIVKKVGNIRILVTDEFHVPFSIFLFSLRNLKNGTAYVVIPNALLADFKQYKIVLMHEIQHHRAGDTRWIYLLEILKVFCFWNPFMWGWVSILNQVQELSCDEVLIHRKKISVRDYGCCLLRIAETILESPQILVGTTGIMGRSSGDFLKWRIQMITRSYQKTGKWSAFALGLSTLSCMGSLAVASSSLQGVHSYSLEEVQGLASGTTRALEVPVEVNPLVLTQFNNYAGTSRGREFVKAALSRLNGDLSQEHQIVEKNMRNFQVPPELIAIPIVESGFRTKRNHSNSVGAGLWGFIRSTGQAYGLTITDEKDDRLDASKSTVAAAKLLTELKNQYGDWRFAIKAYNEGNKSVNRDLEKFRKAHSLGKEERVEAWQLEKEMEGKDQYLSRVTAMILIMKNPSILD